MVKMKALLHFEISVTIQQSTPRNTMETSNPKQYRCDNLKSRNETVTDNIMDMWLYELSEKINNKFRCSNLRLIP